MSSVIIDKDSIVVNGPMHSWSQGERLPPDLYGKYVKVDGPEWVDFNQLINNKEHVLLNNGLTIVVTMDRDRYVSNQCPGWWDRFGAYNCVGTISYGNFNIKKRRKCLTVGMHGSVNVVYVGNDHAFGYKNGQPVILNLDGGLHVPC